MPAFFSIPALRSLKPMQIKLIAIGKTDNKAIQALIDEYSSRLGHYIRFELEVIPDLKNTKSLSEAVQKEKEGELILKKLLPSDDLLLLDERGKMHSSVGCIFCLEVKPLGESRAALEVSINLALAIGHGIHEQISTHERSSPRCAQPAEDFFAVATRPGLVHAELESRNFLTDSLGKGHVVGGNRGNQIAVRHVHGRNKLCFGIDQNN